MREPIRRQTDLTKKTTTITKQTPRMLSDNCTNLVIGSGQIFEGKGCLFLSPTSIYYISVKWKNNTVVNGFLPTSMLLKGGN